jgi:hypothetical protein
MQQGIAPSILIVDGKPAPCRCTIKDGVKTICEFCVQANLILWEREEARGPQLRPGRLINTFKKAQKTRVAEMMGVHRNTVHNMLKSNKIPPKYARRFNRGIEKGIPG